MMVPILEESSSLTRIDKNAKEGILVSIITIVYNGEKYLEQTIRSVLGQSYKNIQYIIIDGGSTDGSIEIIRKYESQIAIWISEPDRGISDAFNKGIALATGDLIGILNADDWYEPEAVSKMVAHFKPDSVLHGNTQYWNENGSRAHQAKPNLDILPLEMSLNHPTVFVSKNLYKRYGVFDLNYKLAMDYQLLLRFYAAGVKFIHIDDIVTNMRLGGVSANIEGCYLEVFKAKNEVLGFRISHKLYYYWTIMRYKVSQGLENTPLAFINRLYRTRMSPIKKQY
ncbi:glycosyltransferase family 2 protein [Pontibacter korlensis]